MSLMPFRGRCMHCGHNHGNGAFDLGDYKPIPVTETQMAELFRLRAENEALKQQVEQGKREAVPEGWKLVPIEPTRYQLDEAHNGPLLASDEIMDAKTEEWLIDMYKAFVRAAPEQEK